MGLFFKLQQIMNENENTYDKSKILGSPVFPKDFFKKNHLDDKFFVAQLNLSELKVDELPQTGFLYFFLDVNTYPFQPKVIYTTDEIIEVYDIVNEDFEEFGSASGYFIKKTDNSVDTGLEIATPYAFNESIENDRNYNDYLSLLAIDSLELPAGVLTLGISDGWYIFAIKKIDLARKSFSAVKFVAFGS